MKYTSYKPSKYTLQYFQVHFHLISVLQEVAKLMLNSSVLSSVAAGENYSRSKTKESACLDLLPSGAAQTTAALKW